MQFCISRKGEIGGGGWAHSQGTVHMAMPGWAVEVTEVFAPATYINRVRKPYCHFVGSSFQAGKGAWGLSRQLLSEIANYCKLVNLCE